MPTNRANFTPPTVGTILDQTYELVDPATLIEHPKNPNEGDVGEIMSSIATTGFFGALHVQTSTRHVCAGNHRLKAAIALGMPEVPVIWIDCDDETAMRVLVADNRIARLGHNNDDALAAILQEIAVTARGLEGTGYDGDDLDLLLADIEGSALGGGPEPLVGDPDAIPEPPAIPVTERGDVWLLGPHRIMCGDCRAPAEVVELMKGVRVNVGFTSPPYASQRKYDESSGFRPIHPDDYVAWFQQVSDNVAAHLADDGSWFVNIKEHCDEGQRHLYVKDLTIAHVRQWAWLFVDELCWVDTKNGVPGTWPNRFKDAWEPVFHFAQKRSIKFDPLANGVVSENVFRSVENAVSSTGSGFTGAGTREYLDGAVARPSNVLLMPAGGAAGIEHSAPFPVALPQWFIRAYSDTGDAVFDPFMGSGSTLLAAHAEGRVGFGMELSPTYVDVICKRFQNATGIIPILEATGEPHDFTTTGEP